MGIPLYRIKDIRMLYGETPWGDNFINFENLECMPSPRGHVIAARITSENPDEVELSFVSKTVRRHNRRPAECLKWLVVLIRRASNPVLAQCRSSTSAAVKTFGVISASARQEACTNLQTLSLDIVSPGARTEKKPSRKAGFVFTSQLY